MLLEMMDDDGNKQNTPNVPENILKNTYFKFENIAIHC